MSTQRMKQKKRGDEGKWKYQCQSQEVAGDEVICSGLDSG